MEMNTTIENVEIDAATGDFISARLQNRRRCGDKFFRDIWP